VFEIVSSDITFPLDLFRGLHKMGQHNRGSSKVGYLGGKRIAFVLSHIDFAFCFGIVYLVVSIYFVLWSLPCVLADKTGWQFCSGE